MKKFLVSSSIFFSGIAFGYFGSYLNDFNKKSDVVKFDLDNYKAKTDYEIWNEKFYYTKDNQWNLERKIKVDDIDFYKLIITGINDKGESERFLIKSKEPLSFFKLSKTNHNKLWVI